eukprot:TRINITY_DN880_c0_g2_i1.p3 TRINITY_DN880_c0_g2~~TRINITY_DN880_c0_g2_i1.p3  ORF type:complete len:110 (-),score=3.71 TRINITY_DN880_c0_g2_i1:286-615(-)
MTSLDEPARERGKCMTFDWARLPRPCPDRRQHKRAPVSGESRLSSLSSSGSNQAREGRLVDALAVRGDEGRDTLRQVMGSREQALIHEFPNGATHLTFHYNQLRLFIVG